MSSTLLVSCGIHYSYRGETHMDINQYYLQWRRSHTAVHVWGTLHISYRRLRGLAVLYFLSITLCRKHASTVAYGKKERPSFKRNDQRAGTRSHTHLYTASNPGVPDVVEVRMRRNCLNQPVFSYNTPTLLC